MTAGWDTPSLEAALADHRRWEAERARRAEEERAAKRKAERERQVRRDERVASALLSMRPGDTIASVAARLRVCPSGVHGMARRLRLLGHAVGSGGGGKSRAALRQRRMDQARDLYYQGYSYDEVAAYFRDDLGAASIAALLRDAGVRNVPLLERAAEYAAAHPEMGARQVAAVLHCSERTVREGQARAKRGRR